MKILSVITALLFTALSVLASPIDAGRCDGPSNGLEISDFGPNGSGVNGSGCPAGTVFTALGNPPNTLTLTYSDYRASAGPGITIDHNYKNCIASLKLKIPRCWTFSIVSVDYVGFYQLDKKVDAYQNANYWFQGQFPGVKASSKFSGPHTGDIYTITDTFGALTWSPCNQTYAILNLGSSINVDNSANPAGSGLITTDAEEVKLKTVWRFKWRRCCDEGNCN